MKIKIVILLLIASLIILINNRTPFFLPSKEGGWSIGYNYYDSIPSKINPEENYIFSIEKLTKISDSTVFLADPFFLKEKDTSYIFFEYQMKKPGADIAVMKSANGLDFKFDRVVLDENFHLSYPQVFKYKDAYYMLPETGKAHNVLLYKAHNFPYDWRICDTLVKNKSLKDPSIYLSDSLNFLVASDDKLNLYMYNSDSLFGKWELNKHKSIVKIGSEARAGGRIFVNKNNKITLPLQNCTEGYGFGISLYELNFDDQGNYDIELSNKFFLKASDKMYEFAGGMHQLDIQKIDDKYFIVYDGKIIENNKMEFKWKTSLKLAYLDTKDFLYRALNLY